MGQIENEYTGQDCTASLKMLNPSYLNGGLTGILIGSYLQSITRKLAVGFETVWQRAALTQGPETAVSLCARYKSDDWIATAQFQAQGALNATYWRRLSDTVQAGVDMTLAVVPSPAGPFGGGLQKEGNTAVGVKYDFKTATFRAQVDSKGKIGCLLEKRVALPVMLTFAADVDHFTVSANQVSDPQLSLTIRSNKQKSASESPLRPALRISKNNRTSLDSRPHRTYHSEPLATRNSTPVQ